MGGGAARATQSHAGLRSRWGSARGGQYLDVISNVVPKICARINSAMVTTGRRCGGFDCAGGRREDAGKSSVEKGGKGDYRTRHSGGHNGGEGVADAA